MKKQRLVGVDQELIEREAAGGRLGDACREAVDAVGNLMSGCLHGDSSFLSDGTLDRAENLPEQYIQILD